MSAFLTKSKKTKNNGFTLIELLVVIIIIGILAGIAVVGVSGARNSAQKAACKADAEQLVKGLRAYNAANGLKFPGDTDFAASATKGNYTFLFSDLEKLWSSSSTQGKFLENPLLSYKGSTVDGEATTAGTYVLVAGVNTSGSLIVVGSDGSKETSPTLNAGFTGLSDSTEQFGDCKVTG